MGRVYDRIDERLAAFITGQPVFFVASAPLSASGHVNCSPKGNRHELAVVDERTVAYLDQTGSGAETIAHLRENGRIVLMFAAFGGPPRVVRLHGVGRVVAAADDEHGRLLVQHFSEAYDLGARAIVVVEVSRISDSCGYGVPLMSFKGHRKAMDEWTDRKGAEGLHDYRAGHNARSLDGLPALEGLEAQPDRA